MPDNVLIISYQEPAINPSTISPCCIEGFFVFYQIVASVTEFPCAVALSFNQN